ncbi:MAG: cytochrome-c peroxidase [Deltaproteobacteria bacterium]
MTKLIGLALFAAACGTTTKPATDPPPTWGVPITGGTILATHDNQRVVVADPDRDRLMVVQLATGATVEIPLQAGDEPGRLIEDAASRIHVALRRGGAVVTLQGTDIVARRAVCAEPRGLAYDAAADAIDVACATGELVTLPAAGGDATRSVFVDRDLRDVLIINNTLYVTRFKKAELLALDASGTITSRTVMPTVERFDNSGEGGAQPPAPGDGGVGSGDTTGLISSIPAVAWRAVALPNGQIAVVHQRAAQRELSVHHGGYGGIGCGSSPIESTITIVTPPNGTNPAATFATAPLQGALPVDLAVSSSGQLAVALAGGKMITTAFASSLAADSEQGCKSNGQGSGDDLGAPTSVAFDGNGDLIAYYPELPALVVTQNGAKRTITLPGDLGYDSGRNMFHEQTPSGLACASCHPEGRDDGLVWKFQELGPRRTQVLAGSILARAPYHWTGDQADLPTLMDDVFAVRMAGTLPTNSEHRSLGPFLERIPAPAPVGLANGDAAARGKAIFESSDTACLGCHAGPLMSTKQIVDVGTGGAFKVPSLVGVGARAPFLHDGCATTLMDRFTTCGGGDLHGKTSQLSAAQLSDLVAYLETL